MCCQPAAAPGAAPPTLELADLFRQFAHELPRLTLDQARVVADIIACRTAQLGGHLNQCDHCGHQDISYNSCRNRHCSKCQGLQQARWLDARQADLLPVEYFHVVLTVPRVLGPVFLANRRLCYNLLFAAASETLQEVALNPARLGARIGFIAVLHSWTQKLGFHPHLHCIVPGGGLSADATQWVSSRRRFFLPVRILATVFRGKLLSKLETALKKGELKTPKDHSPRWLEHAAQKKWIVYCKAPFAGPEQVLSYLGRYTHRIALSNHRLVTLKGRQLTFRWKDRADGNKSKLLTLDAADFLRRFLLHVVPKGFMRIRHYGFLANSVRRKSIALCRTLLAPDQPLHDEIESLAVPETWHQLLQRLTGIDVTLCPVCETGHLVPRKPIPPNPRAWIIPGRATSP